MCVFLCVSMRLLNLLDKEESRSPPQVSSIKINRLLLEEKYSYVHLNCQQKNTRLLGVLKMTALILVFSAFMYDAFEMQMTASATI